MAAKPIPDGFNSVSAHLIVSNVKEALAFYEKAFGAEGGACMTGPDGSVMHAEMRIGNSTIMLAEENPKWDTKSPKSLGGCGCGLHIYTEDADALFQRASDAGCEVVYPIMDAFWGDRYGKLRDPYGHEWGIATHKEDLSPEETQRRGDEWLKSFAAAQACESTEA